jgi:hypothetical protein
VRQIFLIANFLLKVRAKEAEVFIELHPASYGPAGARKIPVRGAFLPDYSPGIAGNPSPIADDGEKIANDWRRIAGNFRASS